MLGQLLGEGRQQARRCFEQDDVRFCGIDAAEVSTHRGAADVRDRARELDACRPAADDHEGQIRALHIRIELVFGTLERDQHAPPHFGRLFERLQSGRKFLPLGMPEIAVARAARKDQVVESDLVSFAPDDLLREVEAIDMAEVDLHIRRPAELHADRHCDIGGIQARGSDLIKQRLKQVVVSMVDEDDPQTLLVGQRLRGRQPGKARPDDDHDFRCSCGDYHLPTYHLPPTTYLA